MQKMRQKCVSQTGLGPTGPTTVLASRFQIPISKCQKRAWALARTRPLSSSRVTPFPSSPLLLPSGSLPTSSKLLHYISLGISYFTTPTIIKFYMGPIMYKAISNHSAFFQRNGLIWPRPTRQIIRETFSYDLYSVDWMCRKSSPWLIKSPWKSREIGSREHVLDDKHTQKKKKKKKKIYRYTFISS